MKNKKIKNFSRYRAVILTVILDILFALLAFYLARTIMFFSVDYPPNYRKYEIWLALASITVTIAMLVFFDCYSAIWKYAGRVEFFKFLFAYVATFIVLMILKLVLYFAFGITLWSTLIITYLLLSIIMSGITRFFYGIGHYLKHIRLSVDDKALKNMKKTVIIGAGYTGSLAVNRFINNPHEGYYPVALIDDDKSKQNMSVYGITVEGGTDDLPAIMERYHAEMIVIAIMNITKSQLKNIYIKCKPFNVPIKILPAMKNADDETNKTVSLRDIKIEELLGREEFKVKEDLMNISVKDKVVLVTGGAGSIGSELCRQALNFGCKHLIVFDMHENGMFFLNNEFAKKYDPNKYTLVVGTVRERKKVEEVIKMYKPDIIFHAAAYKHVPMMEISATEAIKNNVFGTQNVIEVAEQNGVDKMVLISTDKAVNPSNVMGASKRIAEMLIETYGKHSKMKMAAVRFGNVLGSNGSVIPVFLKQIKEGGPITLTDRNIKRYFMSIPEAVRLVLQTGAFATSGEIFVLDMGEPVYIYDLACDLIRINGLIPEKDIPIAITGLRVGEKMFEELRYDQELVDTTAHEGIYVNKMETVDEKKFMAQLDQLKNFAMTENVDETIKMIFTIVPSEYRAKNQTFSSIKDKKDLNANLAAVVHAN